LRILVHDAQHVGEPDIQRRAAGPGAMLDIHRARRPADIADEPWRACDDRRLFRDLIGEAEVARATDCQIILSPHAAFYSAAGFEDLRRETAAAFRRGGTLRNCINLDDVDRAGHARVAV
jgi:hypothetical protein